MYDKDVLSLPSSAGSAHGPTESTDRSRTQCTTTLKTPCAPPPASFEPVSRESWETQFGKRTEKKKLALRPHRDTAFCWMMGWRDGGTEDDGADITEDDGFYTRCLAPVAQDTNREFQDTMIGQVLLFGYVWVIFPIVNFVCLDGVLFL